MSTSSVGRRAARKQKSGVRRYVPRESMEECGGKEGEEQRKESVL